MDRCVRIRVHHGWLLVAATVGLLVLTCLEASGSIVTRYLPFINQSRSYSIFLLRALSELAGLCMSAAVNATLDRATWTLVCGNNNGTSFADFLALQAGTTILGLLSLGVGRGVAALGTRLWALLRLLLMVFIPLIGILIMSQVDISLAFTSIALDPPYLGYAMQPMNASMAGEYTGFADLMLSWKFGDFLSDSTRAVDLTPPAVRTLPCALNSQGDTSGCPRTYFVPGEIILVAPELVTNTSYPDADVLLVNNHRGYLLDYDAGDSATVFDNETECRTYSSRYFTVSAGAVRLCVSNDGPNSLQARLVRCPGSIASTASCLNDTSWFYNVDWTIKVSVSFRTASVAYSRSNGSILWNAFPEGAAADIATPVNSSQILEAYDALLRDTTLLDHESGTPLPLFSSTMFPTFLWLFEPSFSGLSTPSIGDTVYPALQSLIAIPMYLCQSGVVSRLLPYDLAASAVQNSELDLLFSVLSKSPNRTVPGTFASHRFEVVASAPTLIAYMALSGFAVLVCIVVHCVIEFRDSQVPSLSRFPALDLLMHCSVEDEQRRVVYQGRLGVLPGHRTNRQLLGWLATLRVRWARGSKEAGVPLFRFAGGSPEVEPELVSSPGYRDDSQWIQYGIDEYGAGSSMGRKRTAADSLSHSLYLSASNERLIRSPSFAGSGNS